MGNFDTPDSMIALIFNEIALIHAYCSYYIIFCDISNGHHIVRFGHELFKQYCTKMNKYLTNAPTTTLFPSKLVICSDIFDNSMDVIYDIMNAIRNIASWGIIFINSHKWFKTMYKSLKHVYLMINDIYLNKNQIIDMLIMSNFYALYEKFQELYLFYLFNFERRNSHQKSHPKQWKYNYYTNKINLTRKIQLEDEYLKQKLISCNLIYMGLMTIICYITNGIYTGLMNISWNIGTINIYKCTNLINKSYSTRNEIYWDMNKCHSGIKIYIYYNFKSEISRNIFGHLSDFDSNILDHEGVYQNKLHQVSFIFDQYNVLSVSKFHNILIFLMFSMLY